MLAPILLTLASQFALDDPPAKPRQDPQSAVEPRGAVGAGQAFLKRFVGDWEVIKSFYPPQGGEPIRTTGTCRQEMIHDGKFLQSDFVFQVAGKPSTGQGLIGFEPGSGVFTSVWTDARQVKMSFRQGKEPFDGEQIVLHSRSIEPDGKEGRKSRTVTRLEDDGRRIVHRQFNPGPDGRERLLMDLVMTRKPDAPAVAR